MHLVKPLSTSSTKYTTLLSLITIVISFWRLEVITEDLMPFYLKSLSVLRAHRYECITIAHVCIMFSELTDMIVWLLLMSISCEQFVKVSMVLICLNLTVWYKNKYLFLHFSWVLAVNMIVNIVKKYFVYKTVERTKLQAASVQHYEKLNKI